MPSWWLDCQISYINSLHLHHLPHIRSINVHAKFLVLMFLKLNISYEIFLQPLWCAPFCHLRKGLSLSLLWKRRWSWPVTHTTISRDNEIIPPQYSFAIKIMARHMWCRRVTWRDKLWWAHFTNVSLLFAGGGIMLSCYFCFVAPLMKRNTRIIVGVVTCFCCCVVSGCTLLFSVLARPHRNEMEPDDFETADAALAWYAKSWKKWEWLGLTADMWKCGG